MNQTKDIYIDFDDVLCETARHISTLAAELFGSKVRYEEITAFNLQRSFNLTAAQIEELMDMAHQPEFLSEIPPASGSLATMQRLEEAGHRITIVTGRPATCFQGSERWLLRYGFEHLPVVHVDKYGRAPHYTSPKFPPTLSVADLNQLHFDFAIEDAPEALDLLHQRQGCTVVVFNRPWNTSYTLHPNMHRLRTWQEIEHLIINS